MPVKRSKIKKVDNVASSISKSDGCMCGHDCTSTNAPLGGLLIAAFGLLALQINFGLMPNLEWAKAWPLLLVLIGAVIMVKSGICQSRSG